MTSDKLWEAAKNIVVNAEEKKALVDRLRKADKELLYRRILAALSHHSRRNRIFYGNGDEV